MPVLQLLQHIHEDVVVGVYAEECVCHKGFRSGAIGSLIEDGHPAAAMVRCVALILSVAVHLIDRDPDPGPTQFCLHSPFID